jgi:RNA polymerase sigma-70 factor (ECF subfamily)
MIESAHLRAVSGKTAFMTDIQDHPICLPQDSFHPVKFPEGEDWRESDDLLLRRVRERDAAAMTKLFDLYGGMVYSVALRVVRDAGRAEDLLQDIFLLVWRRPECIVLSRGTLAGWLLVVTRNRAIDVLRRRRPTDSVEDYQLSSPINLASEVERRALVRTVTRALATLPAMQRMVLELAYFEGLTQTEIAERTGDPLGTVKTRMRSGLMSLRKACRYEQQGTYRATGFGSVRDGEPSRRRPVRGAASPAHLRGVQRRAQEYCG